MRDHRYDPPITTDITDRIREALGSYQRGPKLAGGRELTTPGRNRPTKPNSARDATRARNRIARASRKQNR